MSRKHISRVRHVLVLVLLAGGADASTLTFTPQNPSIFPSASPLNTAVIQFQAGLSRPERETAGLSQDETVATTVKNAFLARISSDLYNNVFGQGAALSGSASISDGSIISWTTNPANGEKTVNITGTTGTTSITLPANFGSGQ